LAIVKHPRAALRWAALQASASGALLEVVTCVQPPFMMVLYDASLVCPPVLTTPAEVEARAYVLQDRVLRQEFG
jgi:hypothetical protein